MIRLTGVRKAYADGAATVPVLDGVDLEVGAGELLAILGHSGSGKSTLLNLLGGLDADYQGDIVVDGVRLSGLDDRALSAYRASTVAFVFQAFNLLAPLTALQNVLLPTWFAPGDAPPEDLEARARAALDRVGLETKAGRRPDHLSGGERQRVALARALMMRPRVLLCDEPTGNLDRETGAGIIALFRALADEGITVVVVTHEARVSERADRVLRLEDGHLVAGAGGEGAR